MTQSGSYSNHFRCLVTPSPPLMLEWKIPFCFTFHYISGTLGQIVTFSLKLKFVTGLRPCQFLHLKYSSFYFCIYTIFRYFLWCLHLQSTDNAFNFQGWLKIIKFQLREQQQQRDEAEKWEKIIFHKSIYTFELCGRYKMYFLDDVRPLVMLY